MKKSDKGADKGRRKQLVVVNSRGGRRRFLRGMITHDLVQRGLDFDDAYAAARAVRDAVGGRDEVTTAELRDLVQEHVERVFGGQPPPGIAAPERPVPERYVVYNGQKQPFSRGLLARSIHAADVDLDRAYRLVSELEVGLREEGLEVVPSDEIARRVGDLLERFEGAETARRYRLVRQIGNLPRPLVIFVGGASGTGKSTLALELAPLLKIYRISSTDTIRQVMRIVFSQEILPALYSSSFEAAPLAGDQFADEVPGPYEPEFADRLIATFHEQATRVAVGVRAVVERAAGENISMVVEGVHLFPPLVPFPDLEGATYQLPIFLAVPDPEVHRARFLTRGRRGRRADRYLRNFDSIRIIHDYVLQQAENHDVAILDTSYERPPAGSALRLVTSLLQRRVPSLVQPRQAWVEERTPALLLVIDGLADRPVRALGGRTPLQAANTPNLDRLAREGQCGLADPVAPGVVPDTAAGSLAVFGQSPLAMKRGPVEALGAGLELADGDLALRGNFATLDDNGLVVDRRAGRLREDGLELARALDRLHLPGAPDHLAEIRVRVTTEHRLALVFRGDRLSSAIHCSDPGDGAPAQPPLTPEPLDPHDEDAVETARVLALFEQEARRVLGRHPVNERRVAEGLPPANAVLTRGAGMVHRLVPLEEAGMPLRLACIAGDHTILGLAGWLGAETIHEAGMTANLDTRLDRKLELALEALGRHDLVVVHVKGADIAAHDQRPDLKVQFLERLDRQLGELLAAAPANLRIAVASDHATLSESGQHAADPLPVVIWGKGIAPDGVTRFDEQAAAPGDLRRFPLQLLLGRLFELS